ncbi:tetratricopeptide repeat protein, partial [Nostoc sp. NIES-2111]
VFREVWAVEPDDARAWHGVGSGLFALQDGAGAREALGKAVALDGENLEYRQSWGSVLAAAGEWAAAAREWERVRAAKPESVEAASNLGILYVEMGQIAQGEAELRRALQLDRERESGYANLVQLYRRIGKKQEARAVVADWLRRQPQNRKALEFWEELK